MKNIIAKSVFEKLCEATEMKKDARKFTDVSNHLPIAIPEKDQSEKGKFLYDNDEAKGILKRSIVANTYHWLDSHGDVHLSGLFAKSIQERSKRIPHLHDHKFEIGAKVGRPLSFAEIPMKWRALGWAKNGDTEVLLMETQIEKALNENIYSEYLTDQVDQHSVSMQYVKIDLAVNDENYVNEYKVWQDVLPLIGNKAQAEERGYFWAVREAKLIEVSAVLLGSNELTPTMGNKIFQPVSATEKQIEPPQRTLKANDILKYYSL
jgi:hypothetical protein